jgi:hypothetical protein
VAERQVALEVADSRQRRARDAAADFRLEDEAGAIVQGLDVVSWAAAISR